MGKVALTEQEKLIGKHPISSEFFGTWLNCEDLPCTKTKRHRKLLELDNSRSKAIDQLAKWVLKHHKSEKRLRQLRKQVLQNAGFEKLLKNLKLLPNSPVTRKGNFTEVILTEYLMATSKYKLLFYPLRYNRNIDQSMKGDDVLLFDLQDSTNPKIILGEAKFRNVPTRVAIRNIIKSMNKNKLPLSLEFVIEKLMEENDYTTANLLSELSFNEIKQKSNLIYAGLLLSNEHTHKRVNKYLRSSNEKFVFISKSLSNPDELVKDVFKKVKEIISTKIK